MAQETRTEYATFPLAKAAADAAIPTSHWLKEHTGPRRAPFYVLIIEDITEEPVNADGWIQSYGGRRYVAVYDADGALIMHKGMQYEPHWKKP